MMSTFHQAQDLFHHLGFIPEAMLHDWVIDGHGRTHDLLMMAREVDGEEPPADTEKISAMDRGFGPAPPE